MSKKINRKRTTSTNWQCMALVECSLSDLTDPFWFVCHALWFRFFPSSFAKFCVDPEIYVQIPWSSPFSLELFCVKHTHNLSFCTQLPPTLDWPIWNVSSKLLLTRDTTSIHMNWQIFDAQKKIRSEFCFFGYDAVILRCLTLLVVKTKFWWKIRMDVPSHAPPFPPPPSVSRSSLFSHPKDDFIELSSDIETRPNNEWPQTAHIRQRKKQSICTHRVLINAKTSFIRIGNLPKCLLSLMFGMCKFRAFPC